MSNCKKKKLILIGAGSRGIGYTNVTATLPEDFELVAVAEPIDNRREYVKKKHNLPDELCFTTWEPLLEQPKMADVAVICTMDRDHFAPAMAAIEKGYNLLLEKPAAPTPEECRAIQRAAEEKGVFVLICHVLRYTKFFRTLKDVIESGDIGEVVNIQHLECVGNVHQSHSFVRGNWGNSGRSSVMLLQKSCHDMDILAWLIGKKCTRVQSFGSLTHFTRANAPAGSPERCLDGCPHGDTCPYNAVKLYYDDKKNGWFRGTATQRTSPTDEDVLHVLRETQYGKCVYKCDNDVVDHQVVNLEFEGGVTVGFTMSAFNQGGRFIRIMGTRGEIIATMKSPIIQVYDFETRTTKEIDLNARTDDSIVGGHGGGDTGIIFALRDLLDGKIDRSVCGIRESCDNHMIVFAAEESRRTGTVVSMEEFNARYGD